MRLSQPDTAAITRFLQQEAGAPFTYTAVGASRTRTPVPGFTHDHNEIRLGEGAAVFQKAADAIRRWDMFPGGWAYIGPGTPPVRTGEEVVMVARVLGLWWLNSCRIVYVADTPTQYGFAYGTLPGHAECGEEFFRVEMDADGSVWYRLSAFSRPRHWMARLAFPVARYYQKKFVRASKATMWQHCQTKP
jgi:uncharacterized protein (UPF0548 family)